uniref:Uncharacterized protein n=1 Tax=Anguilla anguilla TaxID=7936 RepID=A0A0E9WST1_ANGAN
MDVKKSQPYTPTPLVFTFQRHYLSLTTFILLFKVTTLKTSLKQVFVSHYTIAQFFCV